MLRKAKQMMGMKVAPIPKKVVYLPVKSINAEQLAKLKQKLKLIKKESKLADALLVGLSVGPSGMRDKNNMLTQADLFGKTLQAKAKELDVPLVMFAEESAVMNGMHLMMYGDHILAAEVSMLGNIGQRVTPMYLKDFIEDWHLKFKYVHHGENKVRFNSFEALKQTDIDWIQALFKKRMDYVIDHIMERRGSKISDPDSTRQYLADGNHFYGPKAAQLGLIDQVTTPDAFFQEIFMGEPYTIGDIKLSLGTKIEAALGSGDASILFSGFNQAIDDEMDRVAERVEQEHLMFTDPVQHFQKTALSMPGHSILGNNFTNDRFI